MWQIKKESMLSQLLLVKHANVILNDIHKLQNILEIFRSKIIMLRDWKNTNILDRKDWYKNSATDQFWKRLLM